MLNNNMYEERVAFLCNLEKYIQNIGCPALRTSYLLRCKNITKSCGLPEKHFNVEKRCSYCLLEWKQGYFDTEIKPLKLSKKQRRRLRKINRNDDSNNNKLQKNNLIERKCLFCNKITKIIVSKPDDDSNYKQSNVNKVKKKPKVNLKTLNTAPAIVKEKECINVYTNAKEVFTLNNKNNTIESTKVTSKIIKNSKRKKDKFAGLCKAAVIASANLTQSQDKINTNKLNLFLRKSK